MKYTVILMPEAEADISEAFSYIHARSPGNAARWIRGMYQRIGTLEDLPMRCALAREAKHCREPLRQLLYKSHRIIFRIEEPVKVVHVLCVRHSAQRAIGEPPSAED